MSAVTEHPKEGLGSWIQSQPRLGLGSHWIQFYPLEKRGVSFEVN